MSDEVEIPAPTMGRFEDGIHVIPFRVYYEDTDAGGIVYHANYLRFAERARTEALRLAGIDRAGEGDDGRGWFVVGRLTAEYRAPLVLDDAFVVETSLQEIRKVRMTLRQVLTRSGREMARLTVEVVMIGADRRAMAIPGAMRTRLTQHLKLTPGNSAQ